MTSFLLALLAGFFFGLGVFVGSLMSAQPEPTTSGAAYDAQEPPQDEPQYIRDARAAANGAPWWMDDRSTG